MTDTFDFTIVVLRRGIGRRCVLANRLSEGGNRRRYSVGVLEGGCTGDNHPHGSGSPDMLDRLQARLPCSRSAIRAPTGCSRPSRIRPSATAARAPSCGENTRRLVGDQQDTLPTAARRRATTTAGVQMGPRGAGAGTTCCPISGGTRIITAGPERAPRRRRRMRVDRLRVKWDILRSFIEAADGQSGIPRTKDFQPAATTRASIISGVNQRPAGAGRRPAPFSNQPCRGRTCMSKPAR